MKLLKDHLEHLRKFRISDAILKQSQVRSITDAEARELLGIHSSKSGEDYSGILFPYLDANNHPIGYRIRRDHPGDGGKAKYEMVRGCKHLYLPPGLQDLLHDTTVLVVLVEAEKSALAQLSWAERTGRRILPIATGGCDAWKRKTGKKPLPGGGSEPEKGPSPTLGLIAWQDRLTAVLFDANAMTNRTVRAGRRKLIAELKERGAAVIACAIPTIAGVNGPDDLIAVAGDEAMTEVLSVGSSYTELAQHVVEFNQEFYVVGYFGGKCVICSESIDPVTNTLKLNHQHFKDFYNRYMHELVQVGTDDDGNPEYETKAEAWLHSRDRRQYSEVVFAPGEALADDVRNLWRGFAFTPKEGACGLYLDHLKNNICGGDTEKYDWLLCWMAHKIRNPGLQGYTAVVLKGREGIGKNVCAEGFAHLFGAHYIIVTKKDHVAGHFNAHLRAVCVLIANEAFYAGDRQHQSSLKGLITDRFLMIEAKGVDAVPSRNRLSIFILSNENWVVPAGTDARRYTVFECGDSRMEDTAYFAAIQQQLDSGGYEALLYHLLKKVDLTKFDPHIALLTEALAGQKSQSLRGVESLWFEILHRGALPGGFFDRQGDGNFVQSERLLTWGKRQHHREWSEVNSEQLGILLGINKRRGMGFQNTRKMVPDVGRVHVWHIPNLPEARRIWDENRFKFEWDDNDEWEFPKVGDERPRVKDELPPAKDGEEPPF